MRTRDKKTNNLGDSSCTKYKANYVLHVSAESSNPIVAMVSTLLIVPNVCIECISHKEIWSIINQNQSTNIIL